MECEVPESRSQSHNEDSAIECQTLRFIDADRIRQNDGELRLVVGHHKPGNHGLQTAPGHEVPALSPCQAGENIVGQVGKVTYAGSGLTTASMAMLLFFT